MIGLRFFGESLEDFEALSFDTIIKRRLDLVNSRLHWVAVRAKLQYEKSFNDSVGKIKG